MTDEISIAHPKPVRPGRAGSRRIAALNATTVAELQSLRAYPSVSILASTRPGSTMHGDDVATLRSFTGQAAQRLATEGVADAERLLAALHAMVEEAAGRPTGRGVALFVSAEHASRVDLPVPVVDRCVIDPTFATRDLVRALHHTPRHAVLLLSTDQARLLRGHGSVLASAATGSFPVRRAAGRGTRGETTTDFLRRVDRTLGVALRLSPMPLVLAAAEPTASEFRRLSRHTDRLAGVVKGNHLTTPTDRLVELTRPLLNDYLRSRAGQALEFIERRASVGRVLRDIGSAWLAARWERPEMLAVEEDYFYPARLGPDGDRLLPAVDVDHPEVIDDAVDELIEMVLSRGGWVALVGPGQLPNGSHLALTLRRP
ncbi:hypothetical protein TUM20985_13910 [Mycobacterium antarcticum]|nr:hypothetical protein TUM20985_13910 [Mycolicibacterium sp. TUM20985]